MYPKMIIEIYLASNILLNGFFLKYSTLVAIKSLAMKLMQEATRSVPLKRVLEKSNCN